jgi:hypothetical protein
LYGFTPGAAGNGRHPGVIFLLLMWLPVGWVILGKGIKVCFLLVGMFIMIVNFWLNLLLMWLPVVWDGLNKCTERGFMLLCQVHYDCEILVVISNVEFMQGCLSLLQGLPLPAGTLE